MTSVRSGHDLGAGGGFRLLWQGKFNLSILFSVFQFATNLVEGRRGEKSKIYS